MHVTYLSSSSLFIGCATSDRVLFLPAVSTDVAGSSVAPYRCCDNVEMLLPSIGTVASFDSLSSFAVSDHGVENNTG